MTNPNITFETQGGETIERYTAWEPSMDIPVGTRFECLFATDRLKGTGVIKSVNPHETNRDRQIVADITVERIEYGSSQFFEDVGVIRLQAKMNFWGWLRPAGEDEQKRTWGLGGNIHPEGIWVFKIPAAVSETLYRPEVPTA